MKNNEPLDYRGSVATVEDLPEKAKPGEICYVKESMDMYIFTDKWTLMCSAIETDNSEGKTNCPNCGAVVDLALDACPYCGTPYR